MPKYTDLEVKRYDDKKKNIVRIILIIVLLFVGVGGITYGLYLYINKDVKREAGVYSVEFPNSNEDGPYNENLVLNYYVDDSGGTDANEKFNAVSSYAALEASEIYKSIDSYTAYTDSEGNYNFYNIRALNDPKNLNQKIPISSRLSRILKDAYQKSCTSDSYNLFSGYLHYVWYYLIPGENGDTDPYYNPEMKKTVADAVEVCNKDFYSLDFSEEDLGNGFTQNYVKFSISEEGLALYEEKKDLQEYLDASYGSTFTPYIDLNVLFDAYYLDALASALRKAGYTKGILSTYTGSRIALGDADEAFAYSVPFYTYDSLYRTFPFGSLQTKSAFVCSSIRSFPYYTYEADYVYDDFLEEGKRHSYSLCYSWSTGYSSMNKRNSTLYSSGPNASLAELTLMNLGLVLDEGADAEDYAGCGYDYGVVFENDYRVLHASSGFGSLFKKDGNLLSDYSVDIVK